MKYQVKNDFFFIYFFTILLIEKLSPCIFLFN